MKPNHVPLLVLGVCLTILTSCDRSAPPPDDPPTPPPAVLELGQRITAHAFQVLSSNLVQALETGPVTNALQLCSVQAKPLAQSVAQTYDVQLQRVSHRPRNPANLANETERALLQLFQKELIAGQEPTPSVRSEKSGQTIYYAPIILNKPVCLNCHGQPGTEISPDTLAVIKALYPQDQATGFKQGDLRGLWRIQFSQLPPPKDP